jgi:hypothetical protein
MGRPWSLTLFMYIFHKMRLLVSVITLYSIFGLFVVGGSSQAMAGGHLWPPTQHQFKGLNQVDQDAHKLKGWSVGAPTIHMLSRIWYLFLTLHEFSLKLVENSSLWKVPIIPTKGSYITPTVLLCSLLSRQNTNRQPYKMLLSFCEQTQKNEVIADIHVD